jgi:hypothetical protein
MHFRISAILIIFLTVVIAFVYNQKTSVWFSRLGTIVSWNKFGREPVSTSRVKTVGDALQAYGNDHGLLPPPPITSKPWAGYPEVIWKGYTVLPLPSKPWPIHHLREVENLKGLLAPQISKLHSDINFNYPAELPTTDYWGNPLYYDITADRKSFIVISIGSDRAADSVLVYHFRPNETWRDIAYTDLVFLSTPEGIVH